MTNIVSIEQRLETALLDISALFVEYVALHEDKSIGYATTVFGAAIMERLDRVGKDIMLHSQREDRGTGPDIVQSHVS